MAAGLAPRPGVTALIEAARADDAALVSPVSAWEIAREAKKRPGSLGLAAPPLAVFERLAGQPGVWLAPLTPAILVASVGLDGLGTDDPIDRMIVATSLAHGVRLVTADVRMLAFARGAIDYGRPTGRPSPS